MKGTILICALLALAGCVGKLTGYNFKASVGQTDYDTGYRSLYTGASVDMHFDVKCQRCHGGLHE